MTQQTLEFKWETFRDHLVDTFKDLFNKEEFADVTLVCDDQTQLLTHKVVLGACSPVLNNILMNNPHTHPLLYMRGV